MSINRLSLQIGGGDQKEYEKRKVMREVAKPNTDVDDAMDLFFEENVLPALNGETTGPVREEIVYKEPRSNVDVLSNYITKTVREEPEGYQNPRSLRESYTLEDRLSLLEQDVFTKMAQATPNTLVAGIGASLDSGGGAVNLWDLDDVNIGTPLNGQYPTITDGDALVYNAATKSWVAGTVSGGAAPVDSVNAKTGVVVLDADDVGALPTGGGTMTGGITFNSGQLFPDTLSLTNGGTIAGDVTYTGANDADNSLQTLASVNSLIASGFSAGGNFVFEGTTDVTAAAPTPSGGDFYINIVEGVAESSWTGIAGLTIAANQLVLYSAGSARWFAGAVENNSSFLLKTGGTMTGDLQFSGSHSVKSNSTIKINATSQNEIAQAGVANIILDDNYVRFQNKHIYFQDKIFVEGDYTLEMGSGYNIGINNGTITGNTNVATLNYVNNKITEGTANLPYLPSSGAVSINAGLTVRASSAPNESIFQVVSLSTAAASKAEYFGTIATDSSIATKAYVDSSVQTSVVSNWTTINSTSSGQTTSTMQGTVWYIKYRTTNGGTTVEIIIHASKAGSAVLAGDIVGVLPADAHPSVQVPILFSPKNASTTGDQGPGAFGVITPQGGVAVTFAFNTDISTQAGPGVGSQDYWANFSYSLE